MSKFIVPDDIVILKNQDLKNAEKVYDLSVAAACYTNGKNELKLLLKLYDEDADFTFHILEILSVGSSDYVDILKRLYFDDVKVITVSLEDLKEFSGKCQIISGSPPKINWSTLGVWPKPISLINVLDEFFDEEAVYHD